MKSSFLILLGLALFTSCTKECEDETACGDLSAGLLAYYPFNGNMNDESGNGNNGQAKNGAALTTDMVGRANSAAGFDGVNDYIIVPGSSKLDSDEFTISFQVLLNNINRRNVTVSKINFETGQSLTFGIHQSFASEKFFRFGMTPGTESCSVINQSDTSMGVSTIPTFQTGRWYNITGTFGGGVQKIYVDGVLHRERKRDFNTAKKCANGDLMIGGWWKDDIVSLDGKLDEVRLYNRAIKDCEIAELAHIFKQ